MTFDSPEQEQTNVSNVPPAPQYPNSGFQQSAPPPHFDAIHNQQVPGSLPYSQQPYNSVPYNQSPHGDVSYAQQHPTQQPYVQQPYAQPEYVAQIPTGYAPNNVRNCTGMFVWSILSILVSPLFGGLATWQVTKGQKAYQANVGEKHISNAITLNIVGYVISFLALVGRYAPYQYL